MFHKSVTQSDVFFQIVCFMYFHCLDSDSVVYNLLQTFSRIIIYIRPKLKYCMFAVSDRTNKNGPYPGNVFIDN